MLKPARGEFPDSPAPAELCRESQRAGQSGLAAQRGLKPEKRLFSQASSRVDRSLLARVRVNTQICILPTKIYPHRGYTRVNRWYTSLVVYIIGANPELCSCSGGYPTRCLWEKFTRPNISGLLIFIVRFCFAKNAD